jgi:P4 family phage/plasmid primase-like protien
MTRKISEKNRLAGFRRWPQTAYKVRNAPHDPHYLAEAIIEQSFRDSQGRLTLRYWRGDWSRWDGSCYIPLSEQQLRAQVTSGCKDELVRSGATEIRGNSFRVSRALVSNVIQAITSLVLVDENFEQPIWLGDDEAMPTNLLSMGNGIIDLEAVLGNERAEIQPHTPEYFSQVSLPYPFRRDAQCPRWQAFVREVLEGDEERIRLLQEFFGYCLTPDTSQHKFLVLEGSGANGKSVVCEILTKMLGVDNVSNVPLEIFADRFQLATTLGKLANIAADVGEIGRNAEGYIKQFTSGDRMTFDRKFQPALSAYPTARLVLSTNNRPRFADRSEGVWRRMLLLPFRMEIPPDRRDPMLAQKLMEELPGILNWAIEGLKRLQQQGHFTEPTICKGALEDYRTEMNSAREFLKENYQSCEGATGFILANVLYDQYKDWCQANGYQALTNNMFGKEVKRVFPSSERQKRGTPRLWAYVGIIKRND